MFSYTNLCVFVFICLFFIFFFHPPIHLCSIFYNSPSIYPEMPYFRQLETFLMMDNHKMTHWRVKEWEIIFFFSFFKSSKTIDGDSLRPFSSSSTMPARNKTFPPTTNVPTWIFLPSASASRVLTRREFFLSHTHKTIGMQAVSAIESQKSSTTIRLKQKF